MMQISPSVLIAKIKADCPLLELVGGSPDFSTAESTLKTKMPAAFVVPLAAQASPNTSATMLVSQKITQQFGVILAVKNLRDATGEKAIADLYTLRQQLLSKLVGWIPPGGVSGMEFGGGRVLDMNDQVLWWQDDFNLDTYFRSA